MAADEKIMGYENIKVISPYELKELRELEILQSVNDHAKMKFKGIVAEEVGDTCVRKATSKDEIEVKQVVDGTKVRTVFKGVATSVEVKAVQGIHYLEVEAISYTFELDLKLKSRSFQDKEMKYKQLIQEVIKDYSGADFNDKASNGQKLEKFILQYEETDWQFLKRMASHFETVLVPYSAADGPKFWFGVPSDKSGSLHQDFHYTLKRDRSDYLWTAENYNQGLKEKDFIDYDVLSYNYIDIGNKVKCQGKSLLVAEAKLEMKVGVVEYTYDLRPEKGIRQNLIRNERIIGSGLTGKIIDTKNDKVRLHLDIDEQQEKDKAYWFPYSTRYTAEGNSGCYCMPELEDSVQLHFPNAKEEDGLVMNSLPQDGENNPKMADPGIKYFGTPEDKEMMMNEQELTFSAKSEEKSRIFIKLEENNGIEVESAEQINFHAEKDFLIEAEKNLDIAAQEGIYFNCKESSVILDGETDFTASQIKVEATSLESKDSSEKKVNSPKEEKGVLDSLLDKGNSFLDKHSTTLDVIKLGFEVADMIPAVGKIDDLSKAGIVANSSNYAETALSLLETIPGIGQSVIGSKSGTMINDYAFKNDWFNDTSCSIMFGKTITNARKIKDKKYNLIDKIDSLKTDIKKAIMNKTKEIYVNSTEFHFEKRDELNGPHPSYEEVSKYDSEWVKLTPEMSIYHDNGIGEPELKFIHSDGREAVFDGDTLKPVLEAKYKGTFNYVVPVLPPENKLDIIAWGEYAVKGVGHVVEDVVPYYLTGKKNERNQGEE